MQMWTRQIKRTGTIISVFLPIFILWSEVVANSTLSLDKSESAWEVGGGEYTLELTGSGEAWNLIEKPDWVTVTPSNGVGDRTVTVVVEPNQHELLSRSGELKFDDQIHTVSQNTFPGITGFPEHRKNVVAGEAIVFTLEAPEGGDLSYQWSHNGIDIPGATKPQFRKENAEIKDAGLYAVEVRDQAGNRGKSRSIVRIVPESPEVITWNNYGTSDLKVPYGLTDIIEISADNESGYGLRSDGTLLGWGWLGVWDGRSWKSELAVDIVDFSIRYSGSFARIISLNSDGYLNGETDTGIPEDLGNVIDFSIAGKRGLALTTAGTVIAWDEEHAPEGERIEDLFDVIAVAHGFSYAMALKSDGTVVGWGLAPDDEIYIPQGLDGVVDIDPNATSSRPRALRADGTLVKWDMHEVDSEEEYTFSSPPVALLNSNMVLLEDGRVIRVKKEAESMEFPEGVDNFFMTLIGGALYVGLRDASNDPLPTVSVDTSKLVRKIGDSVSFESTVEGRPLSFQWIKDGEAIEGANQPQLLIEDSVADDSGEYELVVTGGAGEVRSNSLSLTVRNSADIDSASPRRNLVDSGSTMTLTVEASGVGPLTYQWNANGFPIEGATSATLTKENIQYEDAGYYTLDITDDDNLVTREVFFLNVVPGPAATPTSVVTWGDNTYGQCNVPIGLNDAIAVSAGRYHSLALRSNGTVVAWGDNRYGQADVPDDLANVIAIAAGYRHSLALKADGSVVAWGGEYNNLVDIPDGLNDVVSIIADDNYSLALQSDGTVVGWPRQLAASFPFDFKNDFVFINGIGKAGAGIRPDGTVTAWNSTNTQPTDDIDHLENIAWISRNQFFNLVWGEEIQVISPQASSMQLPDNLDSVTSMAMGALNKLVALLDDDTLHVWPESFAEEMPDGLNQVIAISPSTHHGLVLRDPTSDPAPTVSIEAGAYDFYTTDKIMINAEAAVPGCDFQWYKDGEAIEGAYGYSLIIDNAILADAGDYSVRASNTSGAAVSDPVSVNVASDFGRWQEQHFTESELADPSISGRQGSPLGNSVPNIVKFALGFEPDQRIPEDFFKFEQTDSGFRYSFPRSGLRPDIGYSVEISTDLEQWAPNEWVKGQRVEDEIDVPVLFFDYIESVTDPVFLRLRVEEL